MASLPDPREALQGEARKLYESMLARRTQAGAHMGGPYVPLMHRPELAQKVEALGYFLKFESRLPRDVYQFLVLCSSRRTRVAFEWMDHVGAARAAGLTEPILQALQRQDPTELPPPFSLLYAAVDSVLGFRSLPEPLQNKLVELYGMGGIVEIVVIVGFYELIGAINQSFDVPLPPDRSPPF